MQRWPGILIAGAALGAALAAPGARPAGASPEASAAAAAGEVPAAAATLRRLDHPAAKRDPLLRALGRDLARLAAAGRDGVGAAAAAVPRRGAVGGPGSRWVVIDAVARADAGRLLADLRRLGLAGGSAAGRMVSGRLPVDRLAQAAALPGLAFARPALGRALSGSAVSQGDLALRAQQARAAFTVDGTGITVGILSDSFDCAGTGLAADVASGDLPAGVVLLDDAGCPAGDEGRAMAQVVHDVAPGAGIVFRSGLGGQADAAAGILDLAAAGARVIVDDVAYPAEPMFQDGVIAQAADAAAAAGVALYTAAGNRGSLSYDAPYRPSGVAVLFGGDAHDFDPGPGVDLYQRLSIPVDGELVLGLQWDAPFFSVSGPPGAPNDVDVCILDGPATTVIDCAAIPNSGGDPVEVLTFVNDGAYGTEFNLVIEHYDGPPPGRLKYVLFADGAPQEFHTASATLFGHANAAGTRAIGAAFYHDTPEFGVTPPRIEPFSARGGTPILFDAAGARLPAPVTRLRPSLAGADGVNNTFFGADIKDPGDHSDSDRLPNFFGTSAAAAHVAGVAALIRQRNGALSPDQVHAALESSAADMDDPATAGFDPGFDAATGHGLCVADAALASVPECGNGAVEAPEECDDGNPVDDDGCGNDCLLNVCGDGVIHPGNGESCDDGNAVDGDFCRNDCTPNFCGDGRLSNFSVELLINGGFESGTFAGWRTTTLGDGAFVIASPGAPTPTAAFPTAANPSGGAAYALTDPIGPGTRAMEQSFTVPGAANAVVVSFQMFVNDQSGVGPIVAPAGLDHTGPPNQHARIDLLAAGAPALDTGAGIVRNLYLGVDPGPNPHPYTSRSFALSGDLVPGAPYDLRFAEVDNQSFLHLGVDNVSVLASLIEECDDGDNQDGDGCSAACALEGCPRPPEVQGLSFLPDGVTLQWQPQPGAAYDVARTAAVPFGGAPGACVGAATANPWTTDTQQPAVGSAFYYLVRARTACGIGGYGVDSTGTVERLPAACP